MKYFTWAPIMNIDDKFLQKKTNKEALIKRKLYLTSNVLQFKQAMQVTLLSLKISCDVTNLRYLSLNKTKMNSKFSWSQIYGFYIQNNFNFYHLLLNLITFCKCKFIIPKSNTVQIFTPTKVFLFLLNKSQTIRIVYCAVIDGYIWLNILIKKKGSKVQYAIIVKKKEDRKGTYV